MSISNSILRFFSVPLLLLGVSCTSDPAEEPPVSTSKTYGSFTVTLKAPTALTQGYSSILGKIFDAPSPSATTWVKVNEVGSCRVLTPEVPFCDPSCGGGTTCVEGNKCLASGNALGVGKVSVTGVKAKTGETSFEMDLPESFSYQQPNNLILEHPPFEEGGSVVFSAPGSASVPAFTLSGKGIAPLVMLVDSLTLTPGNPIPLQWTPAKTAGASSIYILVDISHHGGTKGKIECETADNGSLTIPAVLTDKLKALGVAGFPKIEITRKAIVKNPAVNVDLILESGVTQLLEIPGLISCFDDLDCPGVQKCQDDAQCK